jgi:hypothetical protein|tara:strand:+ start:292 stop:447 length:156 start_codon:yes stop_codon:yes gene_type:complete
VREEVYSTPEAEFVKNMLSPKRSRYNLKSYINGGKSPFGMPTDDAEAETEL